MWSGKRRSRGPGHAARAEVAGGFPGGLSSITVAQRSEGGAAAVAGVAPLIVGALVLAACVAGAGACTTIDPGPNFVVPQEQFNQDYFFCHVEPELLFAKHCGSGDQGAGDPVNGCQAPEIRSRRRFPTS